MSSREFSLTWYQVLAKKHHASFTCKSPSFGYFLRPSSKMARAFSLSSGVKRRKNDAPRR